MGFFQYIAVANAIISLIRNVKASKEDGSLVDKGEEFLGTTIDILTESKILDTEDSDTLRGNMGGVVALITNLFAFADDLSGEEEVD
jgi:hypothetical protein